MKKADNRSHSWWWDSHISPKNSKWLQENLAEMDTKVNAMLKIIEEDADSFAQRAEMYYRRRPELINLVEEFYRTYRALVERYNFLTREIRQNIAPALQAQLGVSPESAQNSPIDLHLRRGIDGFDIISPSYSYPGASEFDDDNQSEVSTRSWKGHMDDEETSPLGSGVNLESRSFAFRPKFLSLEEETFEKGSQGAVDVDITQLQKDLRRLQDENKTLAAKASEDVSNLKNLRLELSSLQSRMRSLEAEDKLTKKRLKSVLEQGQKLEAENLKLSHALITAKEEKTEIVELRNKEIEKSTAAGRKIEELGQEAASLKQELSTAQLQVAVGLEKIKRCEEENLKLQQRLASLLEEKEKDSLAQKETFEEQLQELQERFLSLEEENAWLKERISQGALEVKRLEDQLMELTSGKESLEQVLSDLHRQIELLESERFAAVLKSQDLEKELEVSQKDRQSLSDQNLWNTGQIIKLEGLIEELQIKCSRLETENVRCSNLITKLESDTDELQELRNRLMAQCEDCEGRCKALQVSESQLKDELVVQSSEITTLHDQKAAVEAIAATTRSQLQEKLSSISSEKEVLACDFERVSNQAKVSEAYCMEMERKTEQSLEESNRCKQDLAAQTVYVKELEDKLSHLMQAKTGLEKRESEFQQAFSELKEKHAQLGVALSHESSLSKNLKDKLSDLENERNMLVVDMQEVQRKLTHLQEEKDLLSNHYTQCQADYQIAVGALRRTEEDLALRMSELTELHTTTAAKREELENETESLKKELARLHAENRSLVQENADCTRMLANAEEKVQGLEPKLSESLAANAAMAVKLSDAAGHAESLRSELLLVGNEKATLTEDFALKTAQILVLQEQITSLEEKEKSLNEDLEKSLERIKGFQIEVERLQQLVSDVKGQNSTLTQEKASLQMENLNMKERIQNIEDELSHIAEEKQLLIKEITSHLESCKKLEVELKGLEHDKDVLQSQIDALQEQLASSEFECKSLKEENRTFVLKLADVEARLINLEPQLSDSKLENRALVSEVSEKVKRIEVLEAQILDLQKEKVALHQEISAKLEHAAALQEQIHAFMEQERSFQAQLQQRSDEVQSLEAEVARLQSAVSKAEEEKMSLAHEQKRSLDESLFVQKTVENLKEQLSHVTEEKAALVREMATHLELCQKMETSIKNLENDKALLEKNLLHAVSLEDQLREEIKDLQKEKEQLSKAFDSEVQSKVEDLQKLQILLNCSLKEQDALTDSLKTRSEEKDMLEVKYADLQVDLRKSKQLAMDNADKLEADIRQLQQTSIALHSDLDTKIKEMNVLQERLLILQSGKKEAEEQLQMDGKQIADLEDKVKMLREALSISQDENERLDKLLGHSVSEHKDIQKALTETKEELEKQISSYKLLQLQMEQTVTSMRELEQDLCKLQGEKETLSKLLAASQHELDSTQGEYTLLQQTSNSCLQEKEEDIQNLHEQLHALEGEKSVLQDTLQKLQNDWILAEEHLKEELSKLKSENLKYEQDCMLQLELAFKLKDEMNGLQSEMTALQECNTVGASQIADLERQLTELQDHTERVSKEFEVKDTELLNLSVKAEQLQQSLLSKEQEIADLKVHLECCNNSKEKLAEDYLLLQNEELNLKSQIAGDAMLVAELKEAISNLEKERASLAKDLTVEAELGLKLQDEMRILKEINEEFEQKLQFESAENQQLRADIKASQEVQILELESKLTKLQTENTAIQTSQQRGAAEAVLFEKYVKDLKDEVSSLQKENGKLLQELASQTDRQEDHERKLQQLLAKAIEENEGLRASIHTYIEQNLESQNRVNDLQLQIDEKHRALERHDTFVSEMEGLQRDLEVAKEEISSLKEGISSKDAATAELQNEIANFQNKDSALKEAVESLNSKLTDAKVEIHRLQDTTESVSSQLEHQSKLVLQMMISIEDVYGMISKDHSKAVPSSGDERLSHVWQCQTVQEGIMTEPTNLEGSVQKTEVVVNDDNNNTAELPPPQGTPEEPVLQEFTSTSMPAVKETLETAIIDRIGKLQKLKVEIGDLLKENNSLKSQSLTAWTEYNLVENSSKELHEQLSHLQAENGRLSLYVKSCNAQIDILQEEAIVRKGNNDELLEELGNADCEVKKLQGMLSDLQREGTEVLMLLKERLIVLQEEIMGLVDVQKQIKWKRDTEAPLHSDHENSLSIVEQRVGLSGLETTVPQRDLQHLSTEKVEWQEEIPELEMGNKYMLAELHSRVHETNMVFAAVDLLKKELPHSGRHLDDKELMVLEPVKELEEQNMETDPKKSDKQMELTVGQLRYHINLQTRLHQALVDEKLEQELLELKEGRKQLKDELQAQVEQVQQMEEELQRLHKLLEDGDKAGGAESGIVDPKQHQKWQQKKEKLVARVSKLQENLVLQRQQIVRLQAGLQADYAAGALQEEAVTKSLEEQVLVLVSKESAPSMEGWDEEQVNRLSKEMERIKTLDRRHSLELQTMGQELSKVGSLIQTAQQQLLIEEDEQEDDDKDGKTEAVSMGAASSSVSSYQFPLKPRGFDFTWLLLLFNPDKKSRMGRSKSSKPWISPPVFLRSMRSSSSSSTVLAKPLRKTVGCCACVSSTNRADHDE